MSIVELQEIVQRLNDLLPDELLDEGVTFSVYTCGYAESISIGDISLWDSDNDDREWDDDMDDYAQTIEEYVVVKFKHIVALLSKFDENYNELCSEEQQ